MRNSLQIQGKYVCPQRIKPIIANYKESEDMCTISVA